MKPVLLGRTFYRACVSVLARACVRTHCRDDDPKEAELKHLWQAYEHVSARLSSHTRSFPHKEVFTHTTYRWPQNTWFSCQRMSYWAAVRRMGQVLIQPCTDELKHQHWPHLMRREQWPMARSGPTRGRSSCALPCLLFRSPVCLPALPSFPPFLPPSLCRSLSPSVPPSPLSRLA